MSGKSNVLFWLAANNQPDTPELVNCILKEAHESRAVLSDETLHSIVNEWKVSVQ